MRFSSLHLLFLLAVNWLAINPVSAAPIFSEPFNYPADYGLAGQNGGTGFSGAWSGGNSSIVSGFSGVSSAVQVGNSTSSRSLSSSISTSTGDIYIAYRVNVSNFNGGNYTGMSLWNDSTEEFFFGIPWAAKNFGFDAHAGNGSADIKSINFTPTANTTYLIILGLVDSATLGKVDIKLWATSDLATSVSTLVAGSANAQLLGVKNDFTFNKLNVAGDYSGSLKLGGLGSSSTAAQAAALSLSSIPEPSTYGLVLGSLALIVASVRRRRTK